MQAHRHELPLDVSLSLPALLLSALRSSEKALVSLLAHEGWGGLLGLEPRGLLLPGSRASWAPRGLSGAQLILELLRWALA